MSDILIPIEPAPDYNDRTQKYLMPPFQDITASEVMAEFEKRCGSGQQYTTFPNTISDDEKAKLEAAGYVVTANTIDSENIDGVEPTYIGFQVALNSTAAAKNMVIGQKGENGIGGGGGGSTLIEKSISANGVYNASDDSADGYSKVTVDVANSYTQADEGKVVSNGALVAQTTHAEITENGTYDITTNNSVSVNVSGGGSEILGYLIDRSITSCNVPNGVTSIGAYSFYRCANLANIIIPNTVVTIETSAFYMCNSLERVDLTSIITISSSAFESCASLSTVILGNNLTTISNKAFKSTPIKSITIPSSVTSISSNAFSETYDITITVNKAEGSLSGAPWGAQRATVIWNG